jgi:hypothetical protein
MYVETSNFQISKIKLQHPVALFVPLVAVCLQLRLLP